MFIFVWYCHLDSLLHTVNLLSGFVITSVNKVTVYIIACYMARVWCRNLGYAIPNLNSFWACSAVSMDARDFFAAVNCKGGQVLHLPPG